MKKFIFITASLAALWSCESIDVALDDGTELQAVSAGITYPLSKEFSNSLMTRSSYSSFETDWENHMQIDLASGVRINTPWNPEYGGANVERYFLEDVKRADGWQIIAHTVNTTNQTYIHQNYIVFHNYLTGIIKCMFYLENYVQQNNAGTIQVRTEGFDYLNFAGIVSFGMDKRLKYSDLYTSILSLANHGSFAPGWNCFQFYVAHSNVGMQSGNNYMYFHPYNYNVSNIAMEMVYEGYSEGRIVNHPKKSGSSFPFDKMISLAGKAAEQFIKSKNTEQTRVNPAVIGAAIGGVAKIVSSLTGKTNSGPDEYDITLTTNGKLSGDGYIMNETAATFGGLSFRIDPEFVGELGSWNLESSPVVEMPTIGLVFSAKYPYQVITKNPKVSYKIKFNPTLESKIIKYWSDYTFIELGKSNDFTDDDFYGENGTAGGGGWKHYPFNGRNYLYAGISENGETIEYSVAEYSLTPVLEPNTFKEDIINFTVFLPKFCGQNIIPRNVFMKLNVYTVTDIEGQIDTTFTSRTYKPIYNWDQEEYDRYKDQYDNMGYYKDSVKPGNPGNPGNPGFPEDPGPIEIKPMD